MFCLSSLGLALRLRRGLGNVVRGVPLNADGYFSLPLFNILNWYALLVGIFGLVVLATHGAGFLACKARGALRSGRAVIGRRLWWVSCCCSSG